MISGFSRKEDKNCTLQGCYAASSGNSLRTLWDNLSVPSSKPQDGTDRRYENCALLSYYAANSGNYLPTFRDNIAVSSFGDSLATFRDRHVVRNVGKELPLLAA